VGINLNEYLDEIIGSESNSIQSLPFVPDIAEFNNTCINKDTPGHAVNLRKWTKDYIEFKNSWGDKVADRGNFSVKDLKYLTCDNNNTIEFVSLMFDYDKINDLGFKTRVDNKLSLYYDTVDLDLIVKEDYELVKNLNSYGLIDGYVEIKVEDGEYQGNMSNGFFHGQGIMRYFDGYIYDGSWINGRKEGYGKMTDSNNNIIYEGKWVNKKPIVTNFQSKYIKYKTKYINLLNQLNQSNQLNQINF
jgi:hypothetical protein